MSIGKRIFELRARAKLSQDKFGEMCDASKSAVSQWENNRTRPTLHNVLLLRERLAEDCGVAFSLDWLLCGSLFAREDRAEYSVKSMPSVARQLVGEISDDALPQVIEYLEFIAAKHPAVKAKRA